MVLSWSTRFQSISRAWAGVQRCPARDSQARDEELCLGHAQAEEDRPLSLVHRLFADPLRLGDLRPHG